MFVPYTNMWNMWKLSEIPGSEIKSVRISGLRINSQT
jgi:hypothetical protein